MKHLAGVRAPVTGDVSGFGFGIASAFLRKGASTLITDINRGKAAGIAPSLDPLATHARGFQVDVTDAEGLGAAGGQVHHPGQPGHLDLLPAGHGADVCGPDAGDGVSPSNEPAAALCMGVNPQSG